MTLYSCNQDEEPKNAILHSSLRKQSYGLYSLRYLP